MQLFQIIKRPWITLALGVALGASACLAADHAESPLAVANRDLDIADFYVFRSPTNSSNVVIAGTYQSIFDRVGGNTGGPLFASDGVYQFYFDRDGDLRSDRTVTVKFQGGPRGQAFSVEGLTTTPINGDVTPLGQTTPIVVSHEGVTAFAGPRDDPFFFDAPAFNAFIANPYIPAAGLRAAGAGAPQNNFRGNVAAIVLEAPITRLTGLTTPNAGTVRFWGKTFRSR